MMDLDKFTLDGKFLMLALDHRESFKKLMGQNDPDIVSDEEVINLKAEIIEALEGQFSAFLIDETYGLKAYESEENIYSRLGLKHSTKPYLLPVEKTGYTDQDGERITELEYNVYQLKEMGASGAKLLLYFNPHLESTTKQIETAKKVMADCQDHDFPLFLEIVTYQTNKNSHHLEKSELVLGSIKMLLQEGVRPSVWKLEYPGDVNSCRMVSGLVEKTPWILLTGGETFELFGDQLEVAVKTGCRGFLAGRALWQEVTKFSGDEKEEFMNKTLPERFKILSEIARSS